MATAAKALTPKQEAFCLEYIKTGNATEAYRRSYDVKPDTKEATINRSAKSLIDNPKIAARIAALGGKAEKQAILTREKHLENLQKMRNMALKDKKYEAAIKAEIACGKVMGHYIEKHEVSAPDGAPLFPKKIELVAPQ